MNSVILVGRLSQDPEFRQINGQNGMFEVTKFSIAVRKDAETAYFFNCEAYGKTAQLVSQYCRKGSQVGIEGSLKQENYTDKNGEKRSAVKVVANRVEFLSSKQETQPTQNTNAYNPNQNMQYNPNVTPPQPQQPYQYQPYQNGYPQVQNFNTPQEQQQAQKLVSELDINNLPF